MQKEEQNLVERIRMAVVSGNHDVLGQTVYDVDSILLGHESFPEELFLALLAIVASPEFQRMSKSWLLLDLFADNIDQLSEFQKTKLATSLEGVYQDITDSTTCFLAAELIGDCFGDQRALDTFVKLKKIGVEVPRVLIPHGLEHFAKKTKDASLRARAIEQLISMKTDASEKVREEVKISLASLAAI